MSDPEVVVDDFDPNIDSAESEGEEDRRDRRSYGLLALLLLLLLLLCCVSATADILLTRGPQQARFIARNLTCLQCHTEKIPDMTKNSVHSPFLREDCTVCHTPHGTQLVAEVTGGVVGQITRYRTLVQWLPLRWWFNILSAVGGSSSTRVQSGGGGLVSKTTRNTQDTASTLVLPEDKLCWMCHGDMGVLLGNQYTHVPFAKGRCTECHDPHASDYTTLLKQAPNKLCFTCHPIGTELNRMEAHPPAKGGWCTDCHSPHASNNRGMLVARQRELCFRCHPTVAMQSNLPTQHQPFLNDNCTGCHEPHGSDTAPLLKKPQPALCYMCHPQIKVQFTQSSHHPLGLNLTCASCHDPHAAQYPKLLHDTNNRFCYECHGDKQQRYEGSAHVVNECIKCHTPHGSPYPPLLLSRQPELCLGCHPQAEGFNKHPIRQKYYDLHAKRGLTCTSSCHNPHGTENDFMIKNYNWMQDAMCLQCHKTVGVYY